MRVGMVRRESGRPQKIKEEKSIYRDFRGPDAKQKKGGGPKRKIRRGKLPNAQNWHRHKIDEAGIISEKRISASGEIKTTRMQRTQTWDPLHANEELEKTF